MPITFTCPRCDKAYTVSDAIAGKRVKCKDCGQEQTAPKPKPADEPMVLDETALVQDGDDEDVPAPRPRSSGGRSAPLPPPRAVSQAPDAPLAPPPRPGDPTKQKKRKKPRTSAAPFSGLQLLLYSIGGMVVAAPISFLVTGGPGLLGLATMAVGLCWLSWGFLSLANTETYSDYSLTREVGMGLPFVRPILRLVSLSLRAARNPLAFGGLLLGLMLTGGGVPMVATLAENRPGGGGPGGLNGNTTGIALVGGKVDIYVKGLEDDATTKLFARKIGDLKDASSNLTKMNYSRDSEGITHFELEPISDPEAFANAIHFGKVTGRSGRSIYMTSELSKDEVAEFENSPDNPQRAIARVMEKPPDDTPPPIKDLLAVKPPADPVDRILSDLRSPDPHIKSRALADLENLPPNDRVGDVAPVLLRMLSGTDSGFLDRVFKALAVWHTPEIVPGLIFKLKDPRFQERNRLIRLLGQIKDPRAIEPLVADLKTHSFELENVLVKDFGSDAEPPLVAELRSLDPEVRRRACELLEKIGGEMTLKAMNALPPDKDDSVREAAKQAYAKIVGRVGPLPGAPSKRK